MQSWFNSSAIFGFVYTIFVIYIMSVMQNKVQTCALGLILKMVLFKF